MTLILNPPVAFVPPFHLDVINSLLSQGFLSKEEFIQLTGGLA
jgi:hypothetical protein